MKIPTCPACDSDTLQHTCLPDKFPWTRDPNVNYFLLNCKSCGKMYCFSIKQFLTLFAFQTIMLAILLVIYNVDRFVIPASFAVIYWGSQYICRYVWCHVAWKEIKDIRAATSRKLHLIFTSVMVLSYPAALLLVVFVF